MFARLVAEQSHCVRFDVKGGEIEEANRFRDLFSYEETMNYEELAGV